MLIVFNYIIKTDLYVDSNVDIVIIFNVKNQHAKNALQMRIYYVQIFDF